MLFGLNAPYWSLFWEYIANLFFWRSAVAHGAQDAPRAYSDSRDTTVLGRSSFPQSGRRLGGPNFLAGAARMAFSFPAGLLIYRMGWQLRARLGFWALSILLLLALATPYKDGAWVREVAVIVLYFPLLVACGATATVSPRIEKLCRALGALSYPLYMTHYAVNWTWADYTTNHTFTSTSVWLEVTLGTCILSAFAWATLKLYDEPVRRYLNGKFGWRRRLHGGAADVHPAGSRPTVLNP